MGHDVFISFSSRDVDIASKVCDRLESFDIKCWFSKRNIKPGEDFQDAIISSIESSKLILLIFSNNSNDSKNVKKELAVAAEHSIPLIPVRVENVSPTGSMRFQLSTNQYIDLFENWESNLRKLAAVICHHTGSTFPPSPGKEKGEEGRDEGSTSEASKFAQTLHPPTRPEPKVWLGKQKKLVIMASFLLLFLVFLTVLILVPKWDKAEPGGNQVVSESETPATRNTLNVTPTGERGTIETRRIETHFDGVFGEITRFDDRGGLVTLELMLRNVTQTPKQICAKADSRLIDESTSQIWRTNIYGGDIPCYDKRNLEPGASHLVWMKFNVPKPYPQKFSFDMGILTRPVEGLHLQ